MKQPEITFRHGSISASIFCVERQDRDGDMVEYRAVRFQRRYRDEEGNWWETQVLRTNDIPKATLVLNKAYEFLTASSMCYETETQLTEEDI